MQRKELLAVKKASSGEAPIGSLAMWMGTTSNIPQGWTVANGAALGRTDYPELFALYGEQYGVGDGSTTFNIPNLLDDYRYLKFETTAGIKQTEGLPNIVATLTTDRSPLYSSTGAFKLSSTGGVEVWDGFSTGCRWYNTLSMDASRCSAIYGKADHVNPSNTSVIPIIRLY